MTKAELIGQVLLKVTGGILTEDNSVLYEDVQALLVPAMNHVVMEQYYLDKQDEEGERIINPLLLTPYTISTISDDTERNQKYITLPQRPVTLPRARAVPFVGSTRGKQFMPLELGAEALVDHYAGINAAVTLYQHEGSKVYFWNLPAGTNAIRVKMLVNVADLADTDEIVLPSGGDLKVIQILVEYFTGQREVPEDVKVNFKNVNSQQ